MLNDFIIRRRDIEEIIFYDGFLFIKPFIKIVTLKTTIEIKIEKKGLNMTKEKLKEWFFSDEAKVLTKDYIYSCIKKG